MEKAIHITKPDSLKYRTPDYTRIYFGTEFCQNLIPPMKDLEKVLNFAGTKGLRFTFVTPFITDGGFRRLDDAFQLLKGRLKGCEVVVNDWGVLEILSKKYKTFKPSLGRLLTRQNRNPAMARVLKKQIPYCIKGKDGKIRIIFHIPPGEHYQRGIRACYVNIPSVQRFLSNFNIDRIELNNLIQGINLENLKFKVSLYTPFVNICTTRFCPMESRFQKIYRINVCKRECQRHYYRLRYKAGPKFIYKRGNTTFYKNPIKLKAIDEKIVDRIVFQPELPF